MGTKLYSAHAQSGGQLGLPPGPDSANIHQYTSNHDKDDQMSTDTSQRPDGKQGADGSARADLPYSLLLELTLHDPDTIHELLLLAEGEPREQFATKALRIGVLALQQAPRSSRSRGVATGK